MLSGTFANRLTFNIFPNSKDSDQIGISIDYEPGTSIQRAQEIAADVNEVIVSVVGDELVRSSYGRNFEVTNRGADILVELTPFRERDITAPILIERLEEQLTNYEPANIVVTLLFSTSNKD